MTTTTYFSQLILFFTIFIYTKEDESFLTFSKADLCRAEPHLSVCGGYGREFSNGRETAEGSIEQGGRQYYGNNPFEDIATRPPPTTRPKHRHYHSLREYYAAKRKERYFQAPSGNSLYYRAYPGLYPKNEHYCPNLRANFMFTCQPSKPLRLDLVEFCKDYSAFCGVMNFHRLPGPRMGPPVGDKTNGHVDVNGHFGFGVGAVPGLEIGTGWGVDVGPVPGMGESVGVGLGLDLGIMGSKTPEAYRRGQDDPNEKGGGIVGLSGGVGVKAPGSGPIGVGSGIGVGR